MAVQDDRERRQYDRDDRRHGGTNDRNERGNMREAPS
jgi:hypothetical protein